MTQLSARFDALLLQSGRSQIQSGKLRVRSRPEAVGGRDLI
ncbi:hypothetical protein T4E_8724 [Trichinella pseudospiralis]|uniref:Uncharacterized protein n=1 Tax=Trichinella pseudospiralis TaxID=6337 RepID=A0A0V0YLP1_TRIPS|nr:hypothetical protein T4E_8724 [Trichinella pseudospiralis]